MSTELLQQTLHRYNQIGWPTNGSENQNLSLCQLRVEIQQFDHCDALHQQLISGELASGWLELQSQVQTFVQPSSQWLFDNNNFPLSGEFASTNPNKGWRLYYNGTGQWDLITLTESSADPAIASEHLYLTQPSQYLARLDSKLEALNYQLYWQLKDNQMQTAFARFIGAKNPCDWISNQDNQTGIQ